MVTDEGLFGVESALRQRELSRAMDAMETFGCKYPERGIAERLGSIRDDYALMAGYWRRGMKDDHMDSVYHGLLRRMYRLFADVASAHSMSQNAFAGTAHDRSGRAVGADTLGETLRGRLEGFVSEAAMLGLEPEHVRKARLDDLYARRQQYVNDVFDCLWTSGQWADGMRQSVTDTILSPTVDATDQQLLVSAVTLGALNQFDINKFRLLVDVYRGSSDTAVRQRALVGCVLAVGHDGCGLFPEVRDLLGELLLDPQSPSELKGLQIQLLYCINAERDTQTIQRDIMPGLLRHNNLHITPNGLEEKDEDSLRDILDPEASEKEMEQVESCFRRMSDMQKAGSDIYFGGFSQMKRFPFFSRTASWFVPFYREHPAVSAVCADSTYRDFMLKMLDSMPFCDSDKYSFALAFQQVVSRMPANMREMLANGSVMGVETGGTDLQSPAYIRRKYLQDLYRFFRLFPSRSFFCNPFDRIAAGKPSYVFFANAVFADTVLARGFTEMAAIMVKRGLFEEAAAVLSNCCDGQKDYQYYMLCGSILLHGKADMPGLSAKTCFAKALELRPDDVKAQAGYARTMFYEGAYAEAADVYSRLVEAVPGNRGYSLGYCACLTNAERYDEALALLYKLDYEHHGDGDISRVMARALMGKGSYGQALNIYETLARQDGYGGEDLVNHGYCQWFLGDIQAAAALFAGYLKSRHAHLGMAELAEYSLKDIVEPERSFILAHGISGTEIYLMVDEICATALR